MDLLGLEELASMDIAELIGVARVFKNKACLEDKFRVQAVKLIAAKLAERTEEKKLDYFIVLAEHADTEQARSTAAIKAYWGIFPRLGMIEGVEIGKFPKPAEFEAMIKGENQGAAHGLLGELLNRYKAQHGTFHSVGHTLQALEFFSEITPQLWEELSKIETNVGGTTEPLPASVVKSAVDAIMYRWDEQNIVEFALAAIKNIASQENAIIVLPQKQGKPVSEWVQKIAAVLCFAVGNELNGWKDVVRNLGRIATIDWELAKKNAGYYRMARQHYTEIMIRLETRGLSHITGLRGAARPENNGTPKPEIIRKKTAA